MKDKSILISVGSIIYIVMSGIDRFVYQIPNIIYIPVAILRYCFNFNQAFSKINLKNKLSVC